MPRKHRPRKGSLQFWPRKRAAKLLPSANWKTIEQRTDKKEGLLGFIAYKAGMANALVEDLTPNSMTLNEQIVLPCTVLECPAMKVLSIRLYKDGKVSTEIISDSLEKELKRKIKLPKNIDKLKKRLEEVKNELSNYDDLRLVCYTQPKLARIKKKPDICEIGIKAESLEKKFEIAKNFLGKEIGVEEVFSPQEVVDVKGVTKGKGLQGPVKRFGIGLKSHKSEKGVRRPGSLGAWTPAKVTFRAPMAGQLGFFTRVQYNNHILFIGKREEAEKLRHFDGYGIIKNPFLVIKGSLQGTKKRPLLITAPQRKSKKKNYKFLELMIGK